MVRKGMLRRLAACSAVMLLWASGVRAEPAAPGPPSPPKAEEPTALEPAPSFGDRFFRGTTPGELPTEKLALVATLYVGAATSVGVGIAALVSAAAKHDDAESFKQNQPRGFCNDLANSSCATYRRLLGDERARREAGIALLGVGGLLVLGGALTAELWRNDTAPRVALDVNAKGAALVIDGRF